MTDKNVKDFDLFGDENEIGPLETELLSNWVSQETKDMPHNAFPVQKIMKEMKPDFFFLSEII